MRRLFSLLAQDGAVQPTFEVGPGKDFELPRVDATDTALQTALGTVFGIIGLVAVIYVIMGGLSYIYSSGDPQKTKSAKDTIIYALVGLVVAVSAEVIIWTVLDRL